MFLLQDNKLYVDKKGSYVGVNVTPTGIEEIMSETTTYKSGILLTPHEVKCKFKNSYKFPISEGEDVGRIRRTKKVIKD